MRSAVPFGSPLTFNTAWCNQCAEKINNFIEILKVDKYFHLKVNTTRHHSANKSLPTPRVASKGKNQSRIAVIVNMEKNKTNAVSDKKGPQQFDSFFVKPKQKTRNNDSYHKPGGSQGFVKNRKTNDKKFNSAKVEKKPFDKKKWRLQKYSKKYKLEQWEEKRKKAVLREYYKEMKDDKPKMDVQKIYEQYADDFDEDQPKEQKSEPKQVKKDNEQFPEPEKGTKKSIAYRKAQAEFQRIKEEKLSKKEEIAKQKAEREEALLKYKKKKAEKYKKLNKKTKKGQPLMKNRIEMLLEKIQSNN